ncbi:MAG: hypothetical protein A2Y13_11685 [Planctomycetes bacterium GWC2_45_44]|nr:MAG: hypothetical protein A2Y13_11685 [Planctomycetes bacterium GWC2_45_44]HBR18928.1 hypothetical protein [Phycisphaerales bacterium]
MYEHHSKPLLPIRQFIYRFLRHALLAMVVITVALGIGVVGYHSFEGLSWLDSFLNASMILGGMGPVDELYYPSAKLFAGFYALFAGLGFIAFAGILMLPFAHRFLHSIHLDSKDTEVRSKK